MKLIVFLFAFASAICTACAMCNTCSAITNLACVDKNKFKTCSGGLPIPPATTCPPGTVCTPDAMVCAPEGTVEPSCNMCNQCDKDQSFACTAYNQFALCLGTSTPDLTMQYLCPDDLVCNIDSPSICIDKNITGIGSTCSWSTIVTTTVEPVTTPTTTTTTTTTANPLTSPAQYCTSIAQRGRFEVLSDSTCTQYISCYSSNGGWHGSVYYCPTGTFFNPNTQMCGVNPPQRCSVVTEICD